MLRKHGSKREEEEENSSHVKLDTIDHDKIDCRNRNKGIGYWPPKITLSIMGHARRSRSCVFVTSWQCFPGRYAQHTVRHMGPNRSPLLILAHAKTATTMKSSKLRQCTEHQRRPIQFGYLNFAHFWKMSGPKENAAGIRKMCADPDQNWISLSGKEEEGGPTWRFWHFAGARAWASTSHADWEAPCCCGVRSAPVVSGQKCITNQERGSADWELSGGTRYSC